MKKGIWLFRIAFILLQIFAGIRVSAQETPAYGKNAISFNLTSMAMNEINMSIEHFISSRRSIEFSGGLVYVNDYLVDQINDWENALFLTEHGYFGRIHYKMFKRTEDKTKWHDYISPGISFQHLYYNDRPVVVDKTDDSLKLYTETLIQDRFRNIAGVEFVWGKVYEASRTFAFEFYFGAGITATMATRTDRSRYATYTNPKNSWKNTTIPDFVDESFYMRPAVLAGIKLRIRM